MRGCLGVTSYPYCSCLLTVTFASLLNKPDALKKSLQETYTILCCWLFKVCARKRHGPEAGVDFTDCNKRSTANVKVLRVCKGPRNPPRVLFAYDHRKDSRTFNFSACAPSFLNGDVTPSSAASPASARSPTASVAHLYRIQTRNLLRL
jgi:hypothetical protein